MKIILALLSCSLSLVAFAQKEQSPYQKFGKITAKDLGKTVYSIDSSAHVVILSDVATTSVEGNTKGWFSLVTKRHTIKHILSKSGYDAANIEIPLYVDGRDEEVVSGLKAVTYNLEGGKVVTTKLEKSGQFTEKVDQNRKVLKFTFPQVKEGSIIEYQYTVNSDFISVLDPWYFQSTSAPTLWSEFNFSVPEFFTYNFLSRGYERFAYNERENRTANFTVTENGGAGAAQSVNFRAGVSDYRWVMKNVQELKEESYTYSLRNHIARMEFQLASQSKPLNPHSYRSTWQEITKNLLQSENFGEKLNASNNWMSDEVKPLFSADDTEAAKARKIFEYVRDNFKCNGDYGIYLSQTLKNVFKSKQGSYSEINLLLTAMLRYADVDANAVLLSTAQHGYAVEYSPMINSMNYLVVQVKDRNNSYYLDGTQNRLGFNRLPLYCYNGHARVVNKEATPVNFSADSISEIKRTNYFVTWKDGKWIASVSQAPGYYESLSIRDIVSEKGENGFQESLNKSYNSDVQVKGLKVDSLKNYNVPVSLSYSLDMNAGDASILYLNPTFSEGYKKNPFTAAERSYPVEMPYRQQEIIVTTIQIPDGYQVDEMPKQMAVKLDEEGKSFFDYRITKSGNTISFINNIRIDKTFFLPEEYYALREFFNLLVKKQSEQIVLKKIL